MVKKGRGRPAKYVLGRDRKPIVGLSCDARGNHYASHAKPRVYFGTDFDEALMRFRAWSAKASAIQLMSARRLVPYDADGKVVEVHGDFIPLPEFVTEESFFTRMRELLRTRPAYVAERTGIPQLANLDDIKPREASLKLTEVWECYADRRRKPSAHWARKLALYWREFTATVGAKTLREVTPDAVRKYHDSVWSRAEKAKHSPTWIKHRLEAVPTILKAALKRGRDADQIRRVLDLCAAFEKPATNGTNPKPIAPKDFAALLAAADAKWNAALLLALNCALYPGEVGALDLDDLDLDRATLVAVRPKTGQTRIATLWSRTVEAIREYLKVRPQKEGPLFVEI